jgi:hypothetical protein
MPKISIALLNMALSSHFDHYLNRPFTSFRENGMSRQPEAVLVENTHFHQLIICLIFFMFFGSDLYCLFFEISLTEWKFETAVKKQSVSSSTGSTHNLGSSHNQLISQGDPTTAAFLKIHRDELKIV